MKSLVRLYPRWWRDRYGAELADLLDELPDRSRTALFIDVLRGAWDAHVRLEPPVPSALRRAAWPGLAIAVVVWLGLSVEIVLSNVVYPSTADNDGLSVLVAYLLVFVALTAAGALARPTATNRWAPVLAGALAGVVIAALTVGTYLVVDNLFLVTISRQQVKIDGFAHSGQSTMRGYVNLSLLYGFGVLTAGLGVIGAGLGGAGGALARAVRRRSTPR